MNGTAGSPPTMHDVDALLPHDPPCSIWGRLMADPCPCCGAFRLDVGHYFYMGCCDACAEIDARQYVEMYAS